jgi:hypothetical protein
MRKVVVFLIVVMAATPALAVIYYPLLTNNTFVYAGFVFGVSAFGSGRF